MIRFDDEKDLQRKICKILNKGGYNFSKEKDGYFCDIVDRNVHAFGEVKQNGKFAPQQLLYGLGREGVNDAQYLFLANEYELRVYAVPDYAEIERFARAISPDLSRAPSSVVEMRFADAAFTMLGTQSQIYTYNDTFKIDAKHPCIFLDDNNYEYFQIVLQKYRIDPAEFIKKFAKTWVNKSRLFLKKDNATIVDLESGNEVIAHRKIINEFDKMLIRSTRIKAENIEKIGHKIDALAPIDVRRKRGKYWSNLEVSDIVSEIVRDLVDPTFIFEPFVGGGSLVRGFVGEVPGVVNDIDSNGVGMLEEEWEGYGWGFKKENFLTTPFSDVMENWGLPRKGETERFVVYSNPPFGASSLKKITLKDEEKDQLEKNFVKSKKIEIPYGSNKTESKYFGDTYGRGDLSLPSIGRMIEIIRNRKDGYLAFFCPFGMLLGRERYNKLLRMLLQDFKFLYGEVFSGSMFNGVAKEKAISFSIWKYNPNSNTEHESLTFFCNQSEYKLKITRLLKDGWRYRDGNKHNLTSEEICVTGCDRYNNPGPKMFRLEPLEGANAMVIKENVKIKLDIPGIPDQLIYALWSTVVGYKSIVGAPLIFDNCYVKFPDVSGTVREILAYTVIYSLINNYCDGKIGFVGMSRVFTFGGDRLTEGAQYLIETFGGQTIGEKETIKSVFDKLKEGKEPDEIDKELRIDIRTEIKKRLDQIGYWDYLPIPDITKDGEDDESTETLVAKKPKTLLHIVRAAKNGL